MLRIQSWFKGKKKTTWMPIALLGVLVFSLLGVLWRYQINLRLLNAIRREDVSAVRALVAQGADPNTTTEIQRPFWEQLRFLLFSHHSSAGSLKSEVGDPALLVFDKKRTNYDAATEDAIRMTLLQHGANPNARDTDGYTALFYASMLNMHRTVNFLLSRGVDPNAKFPENMTPLMGADATDAAALLQHGASVSTTDSTGLTALHGACSRRDPDTVRLLLSHGADVEAKTSDGYTPLMYATDPTSCRLLLEHGADVDARAQDGMTAITNLANTPQCDPEAIKLLLQHKAQIDDNFYLGWTVLHFACYNNNVPLARFLLDHGADIEQQANEGLTPLMCAHKPEIASFLLSRGAQTDVRDDYGRTALEAVTSNPMNTDPKVILLLKQYAAMSLVKPSSEQAQDGRKILLKTLQVYHTLQTYSGQNSCAATFIPKNGQTPRRSNSVVNMEMQKPNKIYLAFNTPTGAEKISSDGQTFHVSRSNPIKFIAVPTAGDLTGLLKLLQTKGDVTADLDPLYFLSHTDLPKELSNITIKRISRDNGHPVYMVTGTTSAHTGTPISVSNPGTTSYWTWWIDRNTSQLYRLEVMTPNFTLTSAGQSSKGTLFRRLTVSNSLLNAEISPSEFVITPPQAAPKKR